MSQQHPSTVADLFERSFNQVVDRSIDSKPAAQYQLNPHQNQHQQFNRWSTNAIKTGPQQELTYNNQFNNSQEVFDQQFNNFASQSNSHLMKHQHSDSNSWSNVRIKTEPLEESMAETQSNNIPEILNQFENCQSFDSQSTSGSCSTQTGQSTPNVQDLPKIKEGSRRLNKAQKCILSGFYSTSRLPINLMEMVEILQTNRSSDQIEWDDEDAITTFETFVNGVNLLNSEKLQTKAEQEITEFWSHHLFIQEQVTPGSRRLNWQQIKTLEEIYRYNGPIHWSVQAYSFHCSRTPDQIVWNEIEVATAFENFLLGSFHKSYGYRKERIQSSIKYFWDLKKPVNLLRPIWPSPFNQYQLDKISSCYDKALKDTNVMINLQNYLNMTSSSGQTKLTLDDVAKCVCIFTAGVLFGRNSENYREAFKEIKKLMEFYLVPDT